MIRIASGHGFWGDWPQAPALQVRSGPIDYLVLDYLAEVTLSIMHRQRSRDPDTGYATDFITDIGVLLPEIVNARIKVIANAGGANPRACARALLDVASEQGIESLSVAIVEGDDLFAELASGGSLARQMTPLEPDGPGFEAIRPGLTGAHAYIGAGPIVEALRLGAQVVITGRCSDPSLFLAPYLHEFNIAPDDWDALAFGTVVGHILECGGQASGGNYLGDWRSVPNPERLGFPIAEMDEKGRAIITKHESLGGLVTSPVIKEQLVYEIGDPKCYTTPDCTADFTTVQLRDLGGDRVEVTGVHGGPAPERLKVACYHEAGWMIAGEITYTWPEAREKALAAGELVRKRTEAKVGPCFEEWRVECIGAGACHGGLAHSVDDPEEVTLRIAARSQDRAACDWLGRELSPLILTGPPGATGFAAGRPRPSKVMAYWPGLIPRECVTPRVEVLAR
jgi:hypothetical protein